MRAKKGRGTGLLLNNRGFTLIEMAIVLIIIGIIIGAVVKGKDLINSAKQKKLYSKYLQGWQLAYNNYYDRTGWILGDDNTPNNTTREGHCNDATNANLVSQLQKIGLEPPPQGVTGAENVRRYVDSQGNEFELTLLFRWNANIGNYIELTSTHGMSFELGMAWDKIIDDIRDGTKGDFRYDNNGTITSTGQAWPDVNTATDNNSVGVLKLQF